MNKARLSDLDTIFRIDAMFYGDGFFTKADLRRMVLNKTKQRVYMSPDRKAYLMTSRCPIGQST